MRVDCPACGQQTRTLETRRADGGAATRRRRECTGCGERFTTFERAEVESAWVRKRDGQRQRFDQRKLRDALLRACHKRDVDPRAIEAIVESAKRELRAAGGELSAQRIGELCLEGLEPLDRGAFLQFAGTLPGEIPVDLGNTRKDGENEVASSVRTEEDAARPTPRRGFERARGDI
jgi:transcriptional repressor NrdR